MVRTPHLPPARHDPPGGAAAAPGARPAAAETASTLLDQAVWRYLDRHVHEIDRQFFYETLSAIKRLGGDITDIEDPFRDFSKKK